MRFKRDSCPRCGSELRVYQHSSECGSIACGLGRSEMDDGSSLYYWRHTREEGLNTRCPIGCLMIFAWEAA